MKARERDAKLIAGIRGGKMTLRQQRAAIRQAHREAMEREAREDELIEARRDEAANQGDAYDD